jgi:hypothetical protein
VAVLIGVEDHVDDESALGVVPFAHGVGAHRAAHLGADLQPGLVPGHSSGFLLGEECRQIELRRGGTLRRDDEFDPQITRVGVRAEFPESGTPESHPTEGRAEVFDGEDLCFEGTDGGS